MSKRLRAAFSDYAGLIETTGVVIKSQKCDLEAVFRLGKKTCSQCPLWGCKFKRST
jgi:hypothetical protein